MMTHIRSRVLPPDKPLTAQTSTTPILDLVEPLPVPADHVVTGKFAVPFLTFVSMIVFTENYSFLVVPFGYLAIALIDVAVHEFGHLLAGWSVGLQFKGVHMGPLLLYRIRTRWAFRFRPKIYRGEAH